jgi:hypothetical protein
MISAFVFVMMLAIEYVNMCTRGAARRAICGGRWRQYLLATGLGATPGCLGAFATVSLYGHGLLSLGALVGCMIATSGDEAFVLLAMNPGMGLLLMSILFLVGLGSAWLTDRLYTDAKWGHRRACEELVIHEHTPCGLSSWRQIVGYWKQCSAHRGVLTIGLLLFIGAVALGEFGPKQWIEQNPLSLLLIACALGVIPESGPHLLFVTLFFEGNIPFSILLASSIVQDGHGMLPLLGDSLAAFAIVKSINLAVGLLVGVAVFSCGY